LVDRWIRRPDSTRRHRRATKFAAAVKLDHPVYDGGGSASQGAQQMPAPIVGKRYAQTLNRYATCLTDGLHLNYTIAKIFEIPAAGCVLLVNAEMRPLLARLGMFDSVHYLAYESGAHLRRLVQQAVMVLDLQNAQLMEGIRRRAQQLLMRRHLVAHRVAQVDASFGGLGRLRGGNFHA
jgi:hypothetical protein